MGCWDAAGLLVLINESKIVGLYKSSVAVYFTVLAVTFYYISGSFVSEGSKSSIFGSLSGGLASTEITGTAFEIGSGFVAALDGSC